MQKRVDTKQAIIDDFLQIKVMTAKNDEKFIARIEKLLSNETDLASDCELVLILQTLKAHEAEYNNEGFKKCCELAAPIFEHLKGPGDWSYLQLNVLSSAIWYLANFDDVLGFYQEAVDILEDERKDNHQYMLIYINLHFNMLLRIIRAKHIERYANIAKLEEIFYHSYDIVTGWFTLNPMKLAAHARRGIFEEDVEQIKAAWEELRDYKKEDTDTAKEKDIKERKKYWYKYSRDEVAEYIGYIDLDFDNLIIQLVMGYNLRIYCEVNGLTAADIADILNTNESVITKVMRGDAGMGMPNWRNLTRKLKVSIDYFFGGYPTVPKGKDPHLLRMEALMEKATPEKRKYILDMIELTLKHGD